MPKSEFDAPHFNDAEAARQHLEGIRWPNGPICPHCGGVERIHKVAGKKHRPGLYACRECNGHFTVTVGTVFERSKIALNVWFRAVYLLCSSKKGMSSHQLHRTLGVTYKTAWFMTHRIREALRTGSLAPMGGLGGVIEVDETYIGRKKGVPVSQGSAHKLKVLSLVNRDTGEARSFKIDNVDMKTIYPILRANIHRETAIVTDEARVYGRLAQRFGEHHSVNHDAGEYGRGWIHTNTIEGFFSVFKRGMKGVYQHCGEQHLHRYLAEFDFRYNNRSKLGVADAARADRALKGIEGKRLTYGKPRRTEA
jgi:transposase-like protein